MTTNAVYFPDKVIEWEEVEPGKLRRKIRAHGGSMMLVEVDFKAGAIGYEHEHPHEQLCHCLSGEFVYSIGDEARTLVAGDSAYVPASVRHGATCIKEGRLLDIFTPQREDFLKQ